MRREGPSSNISTFTYEENPVNDQIRRNTFFARFLSRIGLMTNYQAPVKQSPGMP